MLVGWLGHKICNTRDLHNGCKDVLVQDATTKKLGWWLQMIDVNLGGLKIDDGGGTIADCYGQQTSVKLMVTI